MKKAIIYLITLLLIASCTGNKKSDNVLEKQNEVAQQANKEVIDEKVGTVELLYFHGKQRCLTCMAIEKFSTETVAKEFQEQVDSGKLIYKIIDIDKSLLGSIFFHSSAHPCFSLFKRSSSIKSISIV